MLTIQVQNTNAETTLFGMNSLLWMILTRRQFINKNKYDETSISGTSALIWNVFFYLYAHLIRSIRESFSWLLNNN